jgi:perosamine synthetase
MSEVIPLSVPFIGGNEWIYVKECLDTGWISSAGKFVEKFEEEVCKYTGSKYAVACVNGTSALHISLLLSGVEQNDEVIVPTLSFIAPVNAVKYLNAHPIFMDADQFYNISCEKVIDFINNETKQKNGKCLNKSTGRKIAAIIPVHVFGNAVNIEPLYDICISKNIKIVEDATESLGSKYLTGKFAGKHTGTIGDLGCLSFNGNKIITCGGGGMILTNNEALALKAKYLTTQAKDDEIRYIHNNVGYNFRLTNIQAALGVAQLERLNEYLKIKHENYSLYKESINNISGLKLNETPEYSYNNKWMYALKINKSVLGKNRDELMEYLIINKVQTRPVWFLNHLQKPYVDYQNYKIENALKLISETLNIPCSVGLKKEEIKSVINLLKNG